MHNPSAIIISGAAKYTDYFINLLICRQPFADHLLIIIPFKLKLREQVISRERYKSSKGQNLIRATQRALVL